MPESRAINLFACSTKIPHKQAHRKILEGSPRFPHDSLKILFILVKRRQKREQDHLWLDSLARLDEDSVVIEFLKTSEKNSNSYPKDSNYYHMPH